ncbi:MAG: hypothetical protein AB9897_06770 [Anaerolineaceae bacterium]
MNGFITESVSKITDGIVNAIRLILFYALTTLLILPIRNYFNRPGVLIYIFILLAAAGFEFQRSLLTNRSEAKRAWHGMAAGLFFWQVIRFTADMSSLKLFQETGIIFWVMAVIMVAVLWKKILTVGMRSAMAVLLVCWLERIYQTGFPTISNWPPFVNFGYASIRYIIAVAGAIALVNIVFRSRDLNTRVYNAILIFAAFLFLALGF